jgi:hypothetical protein
VKAVTSVASIRPAVSRVRWISAVKSVSVLVTAPKTWRQPSRSADANLQVAFALAAADEGRVQRDRDWRGSGSRLLHRGFADLLADL